MDKGLRRLTLMKPIRGSGVRGFQRNTTAVTCGAKEATKVALVVDGEDTECFCIQGERSHNGAIVVLSDIYGAAHPDAQRVAASIADATSSTVFLPDLFLGEPWSTSKEAGTSEFEAWRARIPEDWPVRAGLAAGRLAAQGGAPNVATVGFCFGGGKLVDLLASAPPRSAPSGALDTPAYVGGVVFYGTRIDQGALSQVKSPIKIFIGEDDHLISEQERKAFGKIADDLYEAGILCDIRLFPQQPHGFAHQTGIGDPAVRQEAIESACDFLLALL
jgi:carboxymethylenebutenolidase